MTFLRFDATSLFLCSVFREPVSFCAVLKQPVFFRFLGNQSLFDRFSGNQSIFVRFLGNQSLFVRFWGNQSLFVRFWGNQSIFVRFWGNSPDLSFCPVLKQQISCFSFFSRATTVRTKFYMYSLFSLSHLWNTCRDT